MGSIGTMVMGFTETMRPNHLAVIFQTDYGKQSCSKKFFKKCLFIHFHREEKQLLRKRLLKFKYTGFNYELLKYISKNNSDIL